MDNRDEMGHRRVKTDHNPVKLVHSRHNSPGVGDGGSCESFTDRTSQHHGRRDGSTKSCASHQGSREHRADSMESRASHHLQPPEHRRSPDNHQPGSTEYHNSRRAGSTEHRGDQRTKSSEHREDRRAGSREHPSHRRDGSSEHHNFRHTGSMERRGHRRDRSSEHRDYCRKESAERRGYRRSRSRERHSSRDHRSESRDHHDSYRSSRRRYRGRSSSHKDQGSRRYSPASHRLHEDSPRRGSRHQSYRSLEHHHSSSRHRTRSRSPCRSTSHRSHRESPPPQHRRSRIPRQASSFMETPSSSQGYPPSVGSQPGVPRAVPRDGVPHPLAIWESILGPQPAGAQEPEETLLTLDAFHKQPSTPSFKPDYSHPSYNLGQVDPTKRNLFQTPAQKPQLSSQTYRKVCALGNPYELPTDDGASTSSARGRDSAASLLYLSSKASAPFFAAAIADTNMDLSFPEEEEHNQELGLACRAPPKEAPRPYIPVLKSLQANVRQLQKSCNVQRVRWHKTNFQAPPEAEKEFFMPTEVPKTCWQQMKDDAYSWCRPEKAPPAGVEGAASTASMPGPSKPHKVFPWNEARDTELHKLEALARDGLRIANATMIAFAHLLNGSLDPTKMMSQTAQRHTFFMVNDLVHTQASQFARISHRIALQRKLNVVRSLSVSDRNRLMNTRITSDIFGGEWPAIQAQEAELRKKKAEKEAEKEKKRRAQQAAASKSQSFRAKQQENKNQRKDSNQQQQPRPPPQKSAPRKPGPHQDNKKDKDGGHHNKGGGGGRRK